MLIVVSGPSGVGKSHLIALACDSLGWKTVVPWTTRARRASERAGHEYSFCDRVMFQTLIESGEMQFWDYTLRNYYGYDRTLSRVSASEPVIIQALARMGLRIAREIPNSATIFLQMKNPTVGDARLGEREYGGEELLLRREHWAEEHAHATLFDIRVSEGEFADRAAIIELLVETAGSLT